MRLNLPNLLSLARLPLAVLFVMADSPVQQGAIILAAGATDFLDGWLARRFGLDSRSGELLDPITDRLFVLTVLVTLCVREQIRVWELALLLIRDIYNTGAYLVARLRHWTLRFQARLSGKIVTTLQLACVLAFTLAPALARPLLLVTVIASLFSVYDYTRAADIGLRAPR